MVKRFSTVRATQRGSQLHGEEKRDGEDRGDQEKRGAVKRRETSLASNQFPKCSPQPGTHKEIHRVG